MTSTQEKEVEAAQEGSIGAPIARESSTSRDSTAIDIDVGHPTPPAEGIEPDQHTLRKRPWRIRSTPFKDILDFHYRGKGTEDAPFILEWLPSDADGNVTDHENPQTLPDWYKWSLTMTVAIATLAVALASSAYSGAVESILKTYHSSEEVVILGVSLFVLGFALGPLIWAPASEIYGRRNTFIFTYAMFTVWNAAAAGSNSMASLLVFRFLAGAFGSSPLTNAGGTIADIFSANQRGLGMAIFAAAPFLGPSIGPITGGFLGDAAGFRWVQGMLALFSGSLTVLGFLVIPETYGPTLLRRRAATLSKLTGLHYRAPQDAKAVLDIKALYKTSLSRPWKLLFTEPIVAAISVYMSCIYGTLYMLFAAFPIVFQRGHGWNAGVGGLAFLGVLVGMLVAVVYTIFVENPRYIRHANSVGGRAPPEARLPPGIGGGVLIVVGLAWFAGSAGPTVPYIVPILAGAPFGAGMVLVFLSLMNYLIDSYTIYAASVLAANSILRSLFGAAFPLFTTQMYANLGVNWASAVPGFLALACFPFSILFWKYGERIRSKSKMSVEADRILAEMMRPRTPAPAAAKELESV